MLPSRCRTVKPSFDSYIAPTKQWADIIVSSDKEPIADAWLCSSSSHCTAGGLTLLLLQVPRGADNLVAIGLITEHIKLRLARREQQRQ